MSYIVYARKWRPQTFDDVIGQDHAILTLKNAITNARIAHSYLFTGSRGIGKTTVARILSKALNCAEGPTPTPCNECSACKGITTGHFNDVMEIDGASNRGINEVRELRENVKYPPAEGKYKVYIIDEVHMLTSEAFNALLKTLEEPPPHVTFIFATTEPQKIPATILSRCQRFDFRTLSIDQILVRLEAIVSYDSIDVEEGALFLMAQKARGSMRDALSYLDMVVSYCDSGITKKDTVEILGIIDEAVFFEISAILRSGECARLFPLLERISGDGYQLHDLVLGMMEHYHRLLSFRIDRNCGRYDYMPENLRGRYGEEAAQYDVGDLTRLLRILTEAEPSIKRTDQTRILTELTLIRMAHLPRTVDISELLSRLPQDSGEGGNPVTGGKSKSGNPGNPATGKRYETAPRKGPDAVREGTSGEGASTRNARPSPPVPADTPQAEPAPPDRKEAPRGEAAPAASADATPESLDSIIEQWEVVVGQVKKRKITLGSFLSESVPVKGDDRKLVLQFNDHHCFHREEVEKAANQEIIKEEFLKLFGFFPGLSFSSTSRSRQKLQRITHQDSIKNDEKIRTLIQQEPIIKKVIDILDCEIMR